MHNLDPSHTHSPNWKRNISLFIAGQTISLLGSSLVQYAILWYITLETQSGLMMTISIVCGFLPTLLLSPFAGVWVDRFNRKRLIALADGWIAVFTLGLAIWMSLGYQQIGLLFLISAIRACGTAVQSPAIAALFPQLVPTEKLTRVNGIYTSIQSISFLIAPIASAALLSYVSLYAILFIDVATAVVGILILMIFVQVAPRKETNLESAKGYLAEIGNGFRYLQLNRDIRSLFGYMGIFMFLGATPAFLTPLQVVRSYGEELWRLTFIEISFSLGMIIGGLTIAAWGGFRNRIYTMAISCALMSLLVIGLSVTPAFAIYLVCIGCIGVFMPMYNTASTVFIQERVDDTYRGRVFSVFTMMNSSMMPLGMMVFGPLADWLSIEIILVIAGSLLFVSCGLMLRDRVLIESGNRLPSLKPVDSIPASQ